MSVSGAPGADDFPGTDRFEIVRRLGAGGMGVVYEALDRERGTRLALKTLRGLGGNDLLQFKREFRALQEVQHPNLISFGELFEERGQFFFTMELVKGTEILPYVRGWTVAEVPAAFHAADTADVPSALIREAVTSPISSRPSGVHARVALAGSRVDDTRLRSAMMQLAQALVALHAAGKVHRDIKPSNVLVTQDGRVVVLDLGLVTDLALHTAGDRRLAGTLPYMAPEVFFDAVGPAADWYAVGVMLYEMLTSELPFEGSTTPMLLRKRTERPKPPRTLDPDVPEDLDALCMKLLENDPARRPGGREIIRRLGAAQRSLTSLLPPPTSAPIFIGREAEMRTLWSAFDEVASGAAPSRFVVVHGESGIGKTSLVRHFAAQVRAREDALVLSGRCYEREAVRYKGVDAIVDALSQHLAGLDELALATIMPEDPALLALVFPVLRRIPAFAAPAPAPRAEREPRELRSAVFSLLRALFRDLAARGPVLVTIDDLQWADGDSLSLLRELLRPGDAPRIVLVATARGQVQLGDARDVREIALGPLSHVDGVLLARTCAELFHGSVDPALVAEEAAGHPMFIDELVRHLSRSSRATERVRLDDMLRARIGALPAEARMLLETLCVAGIPISEHVAARAGLADSNDFHRWLAVLRGASLVRATNLRGGHAVEARHDRIRAAVTASLDDDARVQRADRLVRALEDIGGGDAETFAAWYRIKGDRARTAEHAAMAAAEAAEVFAFERAAAWYREAIELHGPTAPAALHEGLADALVHAGRGAEAARAYLAAAKRSDDGHIARRGASEALLRSGHIDDGLEVLSGVLGDVDLAFPTTPTAAIVSAVFHRAKLKLRGARPKSRAKVPAGELRRLDAAWSVAVSLSMVDVVRAADFQARALVLALDAGDPKRLSRAFAMSACMMSSEVSTRRAARVYYTHAESIASGLGDPYCDAWVVLARAMLAFNDGAFARALGHADAAQRLLSERCRGVFWELTSARSIAFWSLGYLGSLRELSARVEVLLREAEERGDLYAAVNVRTGAAHLPRLAADNPEASRAESRRAIAEWSRRGFTMQHLFDLFTQSETLLYEGRPTEGLALLRSRWADVERSQLVRAQAGRIFMLDLRGRLELARALEPRSGILERRRLLRGCRDRVRDLEREGVGWATGMARTLAGGIKAAERDGAASRAHFDAALRALDDAEMSLHVAAVRHALGDPRGAAAMRAEGVVDVDRFARMLAPR